MRMFTLLIASWVPVALYAGLIFALSSYSNPLLDPGWDVPNIDKVYHMLEYAVLACLLIRALRLTFPARPMVRLIIWGVVLTALYGLTDELHQAFTPGRNMSVYDALADAVGASAVGFVWLRMLYHRLAIVIR